MLQGKKMQDVKSPIRVLAYKNGNSNRPCFVTSLTKKKKKKQQMVSIILTSGKESER